MAEDSHPNTQTRKGNSKTRVLVADDHPLFRQSVITVLKNEPDLKVVGEASNGIEAIRMVEELSPDVVLMDITMPELDGLEATRQIKEKHPEIAVVVLTIHDDEQHVVEILEAGAAGYLTKSVFGEDIVSSIRSVVNGEMVLSPAIAKRILRLVVRRRARAVSLPTGEKLSARELQIMKLAACGMGNKAIAVELDLTLRTVKRNLDSIFSKLNVSSRTEAVVTGLRAGFLSIEDTK